VLGFAGGRSELCGRKRSSRPRWGLDCLSAPAPFHIRERKRVKRYPERPITTGTPRRTAAATGTSIPTMPQFASSGTVQRPTAALSKHGVRAAAARNSAPPTSAIASTAVTAPMRRPSRMCAQSYRRGEPRQHRHRHDVRRVDASALDAYCRERSDAGDGSAACQQEPLAAPRPQLGGGPLSFASRLRALLADSRPDLLLADRVEATRLAGRDGRSPSRSARRIGDRDATRFGREYGAPQMAGWCGWWSFRPRATATGSGAWRPASICSMCSAVAVCASICAETPRPRTGRAVPRLPRAVVPARPDLHRPQDFNRQLQAWLLLVNARQRRALGRAPTDRTAWPSWAVCGPSELGEVWCGAVRSGGKTAGQVGCAVSWG
jgi:hypothetical protein